MHRADKRRKVWIPGFQGTSALSIHSVFHSCIALQDPPRYCHPRCKRQAMYKTDSDIMRWCEKCNVWQHDKCLDPVGSNHPRHDEDVHLNHRHDPAAGALYPPDFRAILSWPVERSPGPKHRQPFSNEIFVTMAREWYRAEKLPEDWQAQMVAALSPMIDTEARNYLDAAMRSSPPTAKYSCGICSERTI